ncbi:hypothetical protein HXX76_008072 [Chlamydomonas incerta]|uniref:Cation/H+ exchanger transmembrane domain-containing protein n=1 Tax=Chlamydomonas incerta TaxID=51695 RepID=A0A835SV96_CHLIN|nr:hypothetical protein HXX76_008072 [Chlamydomonas incerta]|eukprot:KAG2433703.1 hypothetical protein HXX76_008072 [Chlamydomonas incerta]
MPAAAAGGRLASLEPLYLAVGQALLPGGNAWSALLIFAAAHAGGAVAGVVSARGREALGAVDWAGAAAWRSGDLHLPPLLGMLLSGLVLRNATPRGLVAGLPAAWSATFRALALGTIFLRSGLELDLQVFRRVGPAAVRLLLLPGLAEAFTSAGVAMGLFRMPPFWALTAGFILKAVGPAVVIQTMFDLQRRGLGVDKGIPAIIVGAASFDDMVAISGYSLFSSLALAHDAAAAAGQQHGPGGSSSGGGAHTRGLPHGLVWSLLHGPIDIGLGFVAGLVGASFCAATRLWDSPNKRTCVVFATALALLFALYRFEFRGGGALAALVLGLTVNVLWENGCLFFWGLGRRSGLTRGPQPGYAAEVEARVGLFWRAVAQPLLFGIIGTLVNLRGLSPGVIPRSLAIIVIGLLVRMPMTFLAMTGARLSLRERLFVAVAWTPKATVQAALGAQPLDMIRAAYRGVPGGAPAELLAVGEQILTTAVFAILLCANAGVSAIHVLAPRWLHKTQMSADGQILAPGQEEAAGAGADEGSRQTARHGGGGSGRGRAVAIAITAAAGAADDDADRPSGGGGARGSPASIRRRHGGAGGGTPIAAGDSTKALLGGADGSPPSSAAAATAGVGGGGVLLPVTAMRPLRVGPVGYNWAEESYSPTPRSICRAAERGALDAALAAALAAAGLDRTGGAVTGSGGGGGGIWCRCVGGGDGAPQPSVASGGKDAAAARAAQLQVGGGNGGGKPPLPPRPCAGGDAASSGYGTPVQRSGVLRRCRRCQGIIPAAAAGSATGPLLIAAASPPTLPRPARAIRRGPSPFDAAAGGGAASDGEDGGGGDERDSAASPTAAAAAMAAAGTPTRRHSAPPDAAYGSGEGLAAVAAAQTAAAAAHHAVTMLMMPPGDAPPPAVAAAAGAAAGLPPSAALGNGGGDGTEPATVARAAPPDPESGAAATAGLTARRRCMRRRQLAQQLAEVAAAATAVEALAAQVATAAATVAQQGPTATAAAAAAAPDAHPHAAALEPASGAAATTVTAAPAAGGATGAAGGADVATALLLLRAEELRRAAAGLLLGAAADAAAEDDALGAGGAGAGGGRHQRSRGGGGGTGARARARALASGAGGDDGGEAFGGYWSSSDDNDSGNDGDADGDGDEPGLGGDTGTPTETARAFFRKSLSGIGEAAGAAAGGAASSGAIGGGGGGAGPAAAASRTLLPSATAAPGDVEMSPLPAAAAPSATTGAAGAARPAGAAAPAAGLAVPLRGGVGGGPVPLGSPERATAVTILPRTPPPPPSAPPAAVQPPHQH